MKMLSRILFAFYLLFAFNANALIISSLPYNLTNGSVADATQVMANYNQIVNNVNSNAAHNGANSDITSLSGLTTPLSVAQGGTALFTGGTTGGTANAQTLATVSPSNFALTTGNYVTGIASASNTGALTLNVNATGATAVKKITPLGLAALIGGEVLINTPQTYYYDGTQYELLNPATGTVTTEATLASAGTTDLGTASSNVVSISGTTTITSFGSSATTANPIYYIRFTGALTLTYNATSLIVPGAVSITTAAGDAAIAKYEGSGNWRVVNYMPATGNPIVSTSQSVQSNFKNLKSVWASNTTATITADQLLLENSSNVPFLATSVSCTINSATSGAGGLDTGSLAATTWYYDYVIYNGSTTSCIMSASSTAPTLPGGYTFKTGVISAEYSDASKHFLGFIQYGRDWQYVIGNNLSGLISLASGSSGNPSTPTWTAVAVTTAIPTAIAAKIKLLLFNGTAAATMAAPNNSYGNSTSTSNPAPLLFTGTTQTGQTTIMGEFVLESTNVYYASGGSGDSGLVCMGFTLNI